MKKHLHNFLLWCINRALKKYRKKWHDENFDFGIELGYPKCCVDAFCYDCPEALQVLPHDKTHEVRYNASLIDGVYSGFIPCLEHANQVLEGKIKLHELIKNRNEAFAEFPNIH